VNSTRETWANLQRAETLLVHAAMHRFPAQARGLWDGIELEGAERMYLTRFVSGFDPTHLRIVDYLTRYPFSTAAAIEGAFASLAAKDVLVRNDDVYAFTDHGMQVAHTWLRRVGALLDNVATEVLSASDAETLLQFDHRILDALRQSKGAYPMPIFAHRSRGLQPPFDPPRLWHHWQLAWSMIACDEDAQEHVRVAEGVAPLEWFFRRQLWFVHQRPWRARVRGMSLHALANRYAPVEEPACRQAWAALMAGGHGDGAYDAPRLSAKGLDMHEAAEKASDDLFLSCWPRFGAEEIDALEALVHQVNETCEGVLGDTAGSA